ncbi:hypothetical protein [Thermogemmatispora carboxidivorans]|uniref:hypothetical protein n=1 Tax=Thermogemmatispora carboxidivorans TaxID=1382306 RepID=UPI00138DF900|nr:hypothetical protein [Thermogemmatispora carboxidivorans]
MIELLRHAPGLADLTTDEAQAVGLLMGRLSQMRKEVLPPGQARLRLSPGGSHSTPVSPSECSPSLGTVSVLGVHVTEWPQAPQGGAPDIAALNVRLRTSLADGQAYAQRWLPLRWPFSGTAGDLSLPACP